MMATVNDVCHLVRSKNAGPYWVTFDLFFNSADEFQRYATHAALGPETFAPAIAARKSSIEMP